MGVLRRDSSEFRSHLFTLERLRPVCRSTTGSSNGESHYSVEQEILNFLKENPGKAYNVREITMEVMNVGLAERNVSRPSNIQRLMAELVDVATVATTLDGLVDDGLLERRILDVGKGKRSYYRTRAR